MVGQRLGLRPNESASGLQTTSGPTRRASLRSRRRDRPKRRSCGARRVVNGARPGTIEGVWAPAATDHLRTLLEAAFPDASDLDVEDRTGSGDHFQVSVSSSRFDGLTLVDQHRLVYDALAEPLADGTIHELRIKTRGTT